MELWVRSQDKEHLVKVDNIRIKHEYEQKKVNDNYGRTTAYINGKYRKSFIYTDSAWLGEYETKERALEVLNEIQNRLNLSLGANANNQLVGTTTYVYEMPME